jgi:hypothetical protein
MGALNERQRRYLTAIHEGDQAAESRQKGGAFDWSARRPASVAVAGVRPQD